MKHDRDFDPAYGAAVQVADGVRRLTARNPGPFTFTGTNTYLIGHGPVTVLDPGPVDPQHVKTIIEACEGAPIEAIVVSHTHVDHSPGAQLLKDATGAQIHGCAPYRMARELGSGERNAMDSSSDHDYRPDTEMRDGDRLETSAGTLIALETPGHTDNHLCFALENSGLLFSGDHVMAWSTSIVAPPDGSMRAYMSSLEKLMERRESVYLPGHGGVIEDAHSYMRDLRDHRLHRETSILSKLGRDPISIPDLVLVIYEGLDPVLRPAAALSVFAHLEDLVERGVVAATPAPRLDALFFLKAQA